ncbi:trimeric LpxA-like protein [Cercophora newfieldiana]|uniref:Trimeric LpxA-like protein n=1 Tax=Cercophora newfieldiana TaxID=92897 RepID=A0AA39YDZ9_9PEZI|nr:trimeric LpxA-like protein [Cercophora newfieldiana]
MTFRNPTLKAQTPFVKPPFWVDYGLRVRIGGSTFINRSCMIMDTPVADVIIGERCNIGPNCIIVSVGHAMCAEERAGKQSSIGKPITIGDHVWIGANVTVLGGVTIGDGAVIGAGSVITGNIPPSAVAMGVPARVVRYLNQAPSGVVDYCATVNTLTEAMTYGRQLDRKEELELARLNSSLHALQQQKKALQQQHQSNGVLRSDRPLEVRQHGQGQPETILGWRLKHVVMAVLIFLFIAGPAVAWLLWLLLSQAWYSDTSFSPPLSSLF